MKIKKAIGRTVSVIVSLLIALMIIAVGYLTYCNVTGNIAFFGNHAVIKIVSGSMETEIPINEYILVEKVNADEISVKDVVVFVSRDPAIYGKLNTHRVVEIESGDNGLLFTTKGDNNPVNDELKTSAADIRGRYIKNVGFITSFASIFAKKWVFFSFILIPAFILIVLCIYDFVKKAHTLKKQELIDREVERLKREGLSPAAALNEGENPEADRSEQNYPVNGSCESDAGIIGQSSETLPAEPENAVVEGLTEDIHIPEAADATGNGGCVTLPDTVDGDADKT